MPLSYMLNEYQSGQNVTFIHDHNTAAEIVAQEETSCIEQAPTGQQVNINIQDLVCQQELPLDHNPSAEECINAVVARPAALDVEQRLRWAIRNRKKLVQTLAVGGLSLMIMLPGIMLGVLMKDTTAGIALSYAIIGLIKLLADLYNYLNNRD